MTDMTSHIATMANYAVNASKSEDALRWSQAALNAANALRAGADTTQTTTLILLAVNAKKSEDALRWSQAALNAANAWRAMQPPDKRGYT